MTRLKKSSCGIEAIFFDMNGTLRIREPHEHTQLDASRRILELLAKEDAPDSFWDELTSAHRRYRQWANENLVQLSEKEIWTRWILPDHPHEQVEPIAAELTLAWMERKGRAIPRPEAEETLAELKRRGYRLGVISNSMSTLDIPQCLDDFGWKGYFDVVTLSSFVKHRKPAPQPFLKAASVLNVKPDRCAYVGNRIKKDLAGCKLAGFACGIILVSPVGLRLEDQQESIQPEIIIHSLNDLLDYFPECVDLQPRKRYSYGHSSGI
jgi:putative hydrolase of the HAD superfamily